FDKRQAVVAHELGHIKQRFILWRLAPMIPLLLLPFYAWWQLTTPIFFTEQVTHIMVTIMVAIAFLVYIRTVMIPVNWVLEAGADKIGAKFVGKENMISALLALGSKEEYDESSETHPSISERVKLIDKLEAEE
ncbi:MAG: M48 family metalloprotease, partial [Candidatus Bathyarchaeia archaeon]